MIRRAPTQITVTKADIESEWRQRNKEPESEIDSETVTIGEMKTRDEVAARIGLDETDSV